MKCFQKILLLFFMLFIAVMQASAVYGAGFTKTKTTSFFTINLKPRAFTPQPDKKAYFVRMITQSSLPTVHLMVQFYKVPGMQTRRALNQMGIKLLSYITGCTWFASVPGGMDYDEEKLVSIRWIGHICPEDKISPALGKKLSGKKSWKKKNISVSATFFRDVSLSVATDILKPFHALVVLALLAPDGTTVYFPWTLNPVNPANPAIRNTPDHINNIEQVLVDTPDPGLWIIRVSGSAIPTLS